ASTAGSVPSGTTERSLQVSPTMLQHANLPPFLQFAVTAGTDVELTSGTSVVSQNGSGNASVYARNYLNDLGGTVEGFGYYSGSFRSNGTFAPPYNPSSLDPIRSVAKIDVPAFDMLDLVERAQNASNLGMELRYTDAPVTLTEDVVLGTAEAPVVWHINGSLKTRAPITISGYGIILVKGEVRLTHAFSTAPGSGIGIFSGGEVWVARGTTVHGHLFSRSTSYIDGDLIGSVTSSSLVSIAVSGRVSYTPVPCILTEALWPTGLCDASAWAASQTAGSESGTTTDSTGGSTEPTPTDPAPQTDSGTVDPAPASIDLTTRSQVRKNRRVVHLAWSGATSGRVDIYRDGALVNTVKNNGKLSDGVPSAGAQSFTHQVCESGTQVCSAEVVTNF
ncbi:MAG: hypothetical protein HKN29_15505, partial [Rhodothermales bacterium]|nr:hypothetical protein [Rhodothermales bacterium]